MGHENNKRRLSATLKVSTASRLFSAMHNLLVAVSTRNRGYALSHRLTFSQVKLASFVHLDPLLSESRRGVRGNIVRTCLADPRRKTT